MDGYLERYMDRQDREDREQEWELARREFLRISELSNTVASANYEGRTGFVYLAWFDNGQPHPEPQQPLINWTVCDDGQYADCYQFRMELPFS